jgi:eukaryotic-like serine/threonine-protein kinase
MGTPAYMAPEQAAGDECDHRTDLYAWGMMSYELLTGAHPYATKRSALQLMAAHFSETPPSLREPRFAMPRALSDIVMRCLEKDPDKRPDSTADVLSALDAAGTRDNSSEAPASRAITNLMILPFRVLRSDPDTDFLAFSIPDAVGNALGGLQSLAVRSATAAARYAGEVLDLDRIAREAEVDVVLTGSLVRAGNRIRVTTQLIETPSGTLVWSHAAQVSLQDLFQLQDEVVQGIVDSLSLSLTARERRLLKHDVPASAKAYEFYLRANQASQAATAMDPDSWAVARDLYLQCLDEDPDFAPAWARIGRIYRVMGKWGRGEVETNQAKAEAAFKRALQINPDLSIAHNLYAQLEVDLGRAEDAMLRLIARAQVRGADPELFAGLVHACRFCGLLEASVAAHRQARRLDPGIATSVGQTFFMRGDYAQVIAEDINATPNVRNLALAMLGREAEAVANFRALEAKLHTRYGDLLQCCRALLEGRREESLAAADAVLASELKDPETLFYLARVLARLGERQQATSLVGRAVEYGFFCFPAIARDPWLDSLRGDEAFVAVLRAAETRHRGAKQTFAQAGGDRMLGLDDVQPLATPPLP